MKKIILAMVVAVVFSCAAIPSAASSDTQPADVIIGEEGSNAPSIDPDAPKAEDSIFGSWGNDFFEPGDFVTVDEETMSTSLEMVKNSFKSATNIAIYGILLLIAVFGLADIIHSVAV